MEKWFLTDYSATVARILMIFSADPHAILIPIKWDRKSALSHLILQILQILHSAYSPQV